MASITVPVYATLTCCVVSSRYIMCWHNMAPVVDSSNMELRGQVGLTSHQQILGQYVCALTSSWSALGNANKSISLKDVNTNNVLGKSRAQLHVQKFLVQEDKSKSLSL